MQNMDTLQYSAAQTVQNRPNLHYSTVAKGALNTFQFRHHLPKLPKVCPMAESQIFFPQEPAQNWSTKQYSVAQTAQSKPQNRSSNLKLLKQFRT